jgi:hypothetical protein
MVINNNSNDSVRFIEIYKFVKKLSIDYEILLFEVKIEPLQNCCAAENEIYTQKYNEILASIGRRMGRLIQHAMNEDEDYVTNNSITRLDLAIAELRNHEYFLRNSITSQKVVAERKPVVDTIYVVTKIPELDLSRKNYISAVVDMQNFFGIGFYSTGTLDFGLDALYNFSSDFNLALQPKVGVGRGMYHFALGAYYLAEENYVEPMGNIYIISNNFLGGVGFNANRILFSIGYYFP